jgi:hypothetical protein
MQSNSFRLMKNDSLKICIKLGLIIYWIWNYCNSLIHILQALYKPKCVLDDMNSQRRYLATSLGILQIVFHAGYVTRNWVKGIHPEVGNHITRKICLENYLYAVIRHLNSLLMWHTVELLPPVRYLQKRIYVWCNLLPFHILDPTKDGERK